MSEPLEPETNADQGKTPEQTEPTTAETTLTETDRLRQQVEESQRTVDQLKDQLLRKAAEFENYKRRTEADFGLLIRNANERLLKALLPILDDLDRSLKAGREQKDYDVFFRGIEMVATKLTKILQQEGLATFDAAGKPFDVNYHDALLQIPRADVPPHTVVEEVERGYQLFDKVLRHAKVIVSMAPDTSSKDPNGSQNG
jgi:molecular chaperone GrpE